MVGIYNNFICGDTGNKILESTSNLEVPGKIVAPPLPAKLKKKKTTSEKLRTVCVCI
jgi:hypothetical protein